MTEDADETIYDEEGREDLVDDAEISPGEEGFMKGYDSADDEEPEESDEEDEVEEE